MRRPRTPKDQAPWQRELREAREILRGIADPAFVAWLAERELACPRTILQRILLVTSWASRRLRGPPEPPSTIDRCRALLEAVRRARAGGAA